MHEEVEAGRRELIHSALLRWYRHNARELPWRQTLDPYAILVSEVMLQQTQVDRVLPKYHEFLALFPSLAALASASAADVIRAWSPLGYNRRAVNLHRLAREVITRHGGRLPAELRSLRALPGLGAYTAAAVACFAFDQAEVVVDTNVRRVLLRLESAQSNRPADVHDSEMRALAQTYLPTDQVSSWNQALMDLGATICRASRPLCLICPLRSTCRSAGKVVREERALYRASSVQERFEGSNRHLRGRIVEALRAASDGTAVDALATQLGLQDDEARDRLRSLLEDLERDGLLVHDPDKFTVRLPR